MSEKRYLKWYTFLLTKLNVEKANAALLAEKV